MPQLTLAQVAGFIPIEDYSYQLIERLQRRGYLTDLNPTAQPYTYEQVRVAIKKVDRLSLTETALEWLSQLEITTGQSKDSDALMGRYTLEAGLSESSSKRKDPLRPIDGASHVYPRVVLGAQFNWDSFVAATGLTLDYYYDKDPDGLDIVNRWYMRGEDTYLGYSSKYLDLHIGRFGTHWNRSALEAPLIGKQVQQYDKVQFRIGNERISLRSVYGELDNLDSTNQFSGRGFREGSKRRFVFAHRIDWKPLNSLTLSAFEGDLISATHANMSLKYLQPLHVVFFEQDNTPKNFENNLMVGAGLHFQKGPFTLSGQMIIDDIVVYERKKVKEEGRLEPSTAQLTAYITYADILPNIDLGLSAVVVSSNSYRTDQMEGQWTYAQRSLATLFADYVHIRLFADWYANNKMKGLVIRPNLHVLAQGTGNYRDSFTKKYADGRMLPVVLSGQEIITIRPALELDYRFLNVNTRNNGSINGFEVFVSADLGLNFIRNKDHLKGNQATEFHNLASVRIKKTL
jgi:hypothetical protein